MLFLDIRRGFIAMLFFTIILGGVYPLAITEISYLIASKKAQGSLVVKNNEVIGSSLIGQEFPDDLFQSRPSANNYDGLASGGTSMALNNLLLIKNVSNYIKSLHTSHDM